VTIRMYMESYENVAEYFGAYLPNGIPINFHKYPTNTSIHCPC